MMSFKPLFSFKLSSTSTANEAPVAAFHAVEIRCTEGACQAAKDAGGKRYLATEVPLMPLEQCDRRDQCECSYRHFQDRRHGPRRTADDAVSSRAHTDCVERRRSESRRAKDIAQESEPTSLLEDTYYEHMRKARD